MQDHLTKVLAEWHFSRKLTVEFLKTLDEKQLNYAIPTARGLGPLWKQFRHVGRVQDDYCRALTTLKVEFTEKHSTYEGGANAQKLAGYLDDCDKRFKRCLRQFNEKPNQEIDWFGEPVDIQTHLLRLISHESLHHGQFIIAGYSLDVKFPESWSSWGIH